MLTLTLPFSLNTLETAIRRYLSQPSAQLGEIVPKRLGGGFSGSPVYRLKVCYYDDVGDQGEVNLVYKEGTPWGGALTAEAARREVHFYRTLAPHLPVRTPRILLTAHDAPVEGSGPHEGICTGMATRPAPLPGFSGPDWVLLEALPTEAVWPQVTWTERHYRGALTALADLHAQWWDRPPDPHKHTWIWTPTGAHASALAHDAHEALLEIERARWGGDFFSPEDLSAWLDITARPTPLLDILNAMPHTLIHGDYWPGNIAMRPAAHRDAAEADAPAVFDWQFAGVGPSSYDLACFHATSRWWFGRLPLSLAEMRRHYLTRLNSLLDTRIDRAFFDLSLDAARAWRFATFWPHAILQYSPQLRARRSYLQTMLLAPALASLRRCFGA
jgi:Phosphotransferase enzyme family